MWQRFTERSRRTVFFSQEEAASRDHSLIEDLHLLLALLRESDHVAGKILTHLGVNFDQLRQQANVLLPTGTGTEANGDLQLAPSAKRVIDSSYDESRRLSQNYIGTEHLLLGLAARPRPAAGILAENGATLELLREQVERLANAPVPPPQDLTSVLSALPTPLWDRLCGGGLPIQDIPDEAREHVLRFFGIRSDNPTTQLLLSQCTLRFLVLGQPNTDGPSMARLEQWELSRYNRVGDGCCEASSPDAKVKPISLYRA